MPYQPPPLAYELFQHCELLEVPKGWRAIVDALAVAAYTWREQQNAARCLPNNFGFTQIKERHGGLHIITRNGCVTTDLLCDLALALSYKHCSTCGKLASRYVYNNFIRTHCDEHKLISPSNAS